MRGLFVKTKINSSLAFYRAACLLLFTAFVVNAERLPVKIYTSADGLGSSATFNLVRDSRGFIWICSRDGLVRFDGYRFITYRIGDTDADPAVFNLLPTRRSGVYWVDLNRGTDYRFIPKSDESLVEQIQQSPAKNDARIPLLAESLPPDAPLPDFEDAAGNLWTANNEGIHLLREIDGRMTSEVFELNLPGNPDKGLTRAVFKNSEQNDSGFWIGTHWGLVRRLTGGKMIHFAINPQNQRDAVFVYAEDKERRVWIARPEGLVALKTEAFSESANLSDFTSRRAVVKQGVFDAAGQAQLPEQAGEASMFSFADILRRDSENSSKPNYLKPEIYAIICASDGRLWMTSNHGLIVFDGKRFHQYTTEQGLASNTIASVAEDGEGHIWLTAYGGLHRINPKGLTTFDRTDGLENERIHSIYEDRSGQLVVVSGNFNISGLQPDGTFKMVRPALPAGSIWMWSTNAALLDSRGDWWVNTQTAVYRYAGASRIEDLNNKPPSAVYNEAGGLMSGNNVRVFEDSKGDVWFSTWVTSKRLGLTRWRRETGEFEQFTKEDGLPESFVAVAFAEDAAGNLWFGYTDGGITRFRDGRFTILDEPNAPKGGITNIFRDKRGRIWIATNREGLIRVDAAESEHPIFKRYTIADGLTSNNVRCVTEDLYGNIYVGTVRGVNRLSPESGHIKYYGTSDGLASDFINTAYRDRHGMIWFGTFNGLSKLVPEPDAAPAPPAPVLIGSLRIAGEDYSVSPLGQHEVYAPQQSADRNNLQIEFLSIATGGISSTRYQYKLEGVDADWSEPSAERSVTFANLSPGAYRFLVRAVNTDNAASAPALVSFTILRPVWQRWWFLLLAAFAVSFLIYVVYRYRIAQIIKLERVRTRIATDLHDDIGSSLSKIAILSEVVRQRNGSNGNEKDERNEPLEIIANTSREMVDSMSDIVWAINPERDHLSDLIQRMRHFAEELLDAQDIGYQFRVPENLKDISLGADQRREIYLIFKECVNNLAKHSGASVAEIAVRLENDNLIIEVKDNGRGFDVAEKSGGGAENGFGGNGLINMKKRARKCGGDFRIDAEIGKGTSITLEIPVAKNYFSV